MNLNRIGVLMVALAMTIATIGCEEDLKANRDRLTGQPIEPRVQHRFYRPMTMNAAMHDMSVADIHFVPHTDELNGLGVTRLSDLAIILDRYGGTVRYETFVKDRDRVNARLASIERYLTETGIDMTHVEVASKLSGGRGMTAKDAIAAKKKAAEAVLESYSGVTVK